MHNLFALSTAEIYGQAAYYYIKLPAYMMKQQIL